MTGLADFLLARIAEDEAAARGVRPGPRTVRTNAPDVEQYLAVWHPDRVLAECDAKRRIVEREARFFEPRDDLPAELTVVEDEWQSEREWVWVKFVTGAEEQMSQATYRERFMRPAISATMRLLALPYADHPDYREEWRP
jgi:hypothetical protein